MSASKVRVFAGPARSGKSDTMYDEIIDRAFYNPGEKIFLVVPEQVSGNLEQKLIKRMRSRHGQMGFFNLDILGFGRLAYHIFEELKIGMADVLGEYGRSMLIRAAAGSVRNNLSYYRNSIDKNGFIEKVKSVLSELSQYNVTDRDLFSAVEALKGKDEQRKDSTGEKLEDFMRIMQAVSENPILSEKYRLPETLLENLGAVLKERKIEIIQDASFYFDNFRGFTPIQLKILDGLFCHAKDMTFTLCLDSELLTKEHNIEPYDLFYNSMETFQDLKKLFPVIDIVSFERNGWSAKSQGTSDNMLRHLEKNIFRFPVEEYSGEMDGELAVWKCRDPEHELKEVARDIRRRVRTSEGKLRYRDFAVITADLDLLDNYIDSVFQDYEIPYFLDYERQFGNNPYTTVLLGLLRIVAKDFEYDAIFSCLKTGLFPYETEDVERLENYVLRTGIRGKRTWLKPINCKVKKLDGTLAVSEELELAEEVRREFVESMTPLLKIGQKKCEVSQIVSAVKQIIGSEGLDFQNQIYQFALELEESGEFAKAKEYAGLYSVIEDLLNKTAELLQDMKFTLEEMAEILETGVNGIGIGIVPPVLDSVLIGDFERSKVEDVSFIYIIDAVDGILPRLTKNSCLITDFDRKKILDAFEQKGIDKRLAPSEEQNTYYEQFYLYQMMAKPKERLVIAYPIAARDGSSQEASYIIGRLHKIFPMLTEENYISETEKTDFAGETRKVARFSMADNLRELMEATSDYKETLVRTAELAPYFSVEDYKEALTYQNKADVLEKALLDEMKLKVSISKIQKYADCPYQFFLQYILGLTQRKQHEAGADEIGNIVHRALELIFEEVKEKEGNRWKSLEDGKLYEIVGRNLENAIREEGEALALSMESEDGKLKFVRDNVERLTNRAVEILKFQMSDGEMLPEYLETGFSAGFVTKNENGSETPVTIIGKIDRGDIFEEDDNYYLRIIDYKTGNKSLNLEGLIQGNDLQLTVYLDILLKLLKKEMKGKNIVPAGMYFYHVADEIVKDPKVAEGDSEEVIKEKVEEAYREELRLRGIPNYDPYPSKESPVEETQIHRSLEIQEKRTVNTESREIEPGKILPISSGKTSVPYTVRKLSADTFLMNTEDYEVVREYSGIRLRELTKEIGSGCIDKVKIIPGSGLKDKCSYCAYKQVCRFSEDAKSGKVINREKTPKQTELLEEIRRRVEADRSSEQPIGAEYFGLKFLPKQRKGALLSEEEAEARWESIVDMFDDLDDDGSDDIFDE